MSSRSVNKIILVGNAGRDPELRETPNGTKVATVAIATNRRTREGEPERTDWHRLTFWGRLAEYAAKYIEKGDRIYVEGEMRYDSYERDGVTIPTAEVHVQELVLLRSGRPEVSGG